MTDRRKRGQNPHASAESSSQGLPTIFSGELTTLPALTSFHASDCETGGRREHDTLDSPHSSSSDDMEEVSVSSDASLDEIRRRLREMDSTDDATDNNNAGDSRGPGSTASSSTTGWIDVSDSSSFDESREEPKKPLASRKSEHVQSRVDETKKKGATPPPVPYRRQKLAHVQYLSSIDVASTNKDISTVAPIGEQDAREAFHPKVPQYVPFDDAAGDDLSSIDCYTTHNTVTSQQKNPSASLRLARVDEEMVDIELEKQDVDNLSLPEEKEVSWLSQRSRLEMFLIAFISFSVLVLIILIAIVAKKR